MPGKLRISALIIFGLILSSTMLWSQKSLVKAKRQFELKAFELAIENAKEALDVNSDCVDCHFIIAESFRMMNQNVDAAIWYRKMEKFDQLPESYYLNYGHLLKKMGQYDKAREAYLNYESKDMVLASHFAESCDFAKSVLSRDMDFELNLYSASSRNSDFGAGIFKNKLVFASFRDDFKRSLEKMNKSLVHPRGSQLFIGSASIDGGTAELDFLLHDNEETYDMGPVHYAANSPVCAVTRHNFKDGEQQVFSNDLELSLFLATVEPDGSFHKLKAFPFNEVGYATGFGTLNASGTILYFASNRPGGYGGFDIYVSYYKNDSWTYPENLGPRINSPGNEVTPFYDGEMLYYSSDYLKGLGGLDVFSSYVKDGNWQRPANMGNGINSPEDDFYFIKHPGKASYYITSNRLGGKGSYDIYILNKTEKIEPVIELAYEDVIPAEVNITEELVESTPAEARATAVKMEEETRIEERIEIASIEAEPNALPERIESIVPRAEKIIETSAPTTEIDKKAVHDFDAMYAPHTAEGASLIAAGLDLSDAKRVAFGDLLINHGNVYFIQLAALFRTAGNIDAFMPLRQFGSIYKIKSPRSTKVKLGYFLDEARAKQVLDQVKSMGYSDAFITFEELNTSQLELIEVSEKTAQNYAMGGFKTDETTGVNFKVRLASYEDPIWFDVESVKDLGVIEQWSKNQWTIFILSGYDSLDQAQKAMLIAKNRGFKDAEIVLDRNGILERFR